MNLKVDHHIGGKYRGFFLLFHILMPYNIILYFRLPYIHVSNSALFSTYYFSTLNYIDVVLTLSIVDLWLQTLQIESVAKHGTFLLIILSLVCKSDYKGGPC